MNDKNRMYYFMGGTLAVGVFVALFMLLTQKKTGTNESNEKEIPPVSNKAELEVKIYEINMNNVSPAQYNTLRTEIVSSLEAKTIVKPTQDYLLDDLERKYTDLTLQKINKYFAEDPLNEPAMQPLISHLQSLGKGLQEISNIRAKINEINYYTKVLPVEVNKFTSASFQYFDEGKYNALKTELQNLPTTKPSLKNRNSVQAVKSSSLIKLTNYYKKYVDYNMAMQDVQININGN